MLVLPARSDATALIAFAPGVNVTGHCACVSAIVASTPLHVTPATPESPSLTVPLITTTPVDTVVPAAGDVNVNTGGVLSMLTVALPVPAFPAKSVAVPPTI